MKDWFVGQDVWDLFRGHGKVTAINDLEYGIMIHLDDSGRGYGCNKEGVCYSESFQRVYQNPVKIVEER